MDPDRAYLWKRLKLWAQNPTDAPVTRRRWEFFYKHRGAAAGTADSSPVGDAPASLRAAAPAGEKAAAPGADDGADRGRGDVERRRARREASRGVAPVLQREA